MSATARAKLLTLYVTIEQLRQQVFEELSSAYEDFDGSPQLGREVELREDESRVTSRHSRKINSLVSSAKLE